MTLTEMFLAQLIEPFRIGLLIALIYTTMRTAAVSGTVIPLLAGIVFVAVIIPVSFNPGADQLAWRIGTGLVANALILGLLLLLKAGLERLRR